MKTRKCYGRVVLDPRPSLAQRAFLHAAAFLTGAIVSTFFAVTFLP